MEGESRWWSTPASQSASAVGSRVMPDAPSGGGGRLFRVRLSLGLGGPHFGGLPWKGDGRSASVRAVDVPALQDVPAWERSVTWPIRGCRLAPRGLLKSRRARLPAFCGRRRGMWIDCLWPIRFAANDSEIRRTLCRVGMPRGRLLAVFTEGVDLGPPDRGKASEACEIGGLGTRSHAAPEAERRQVRGGGSGV